MSTDPRTTDLGYPGAAWTYTLLSEPDLSYELARLASTNTHGSTDSVSFQPSPNPECYSQDRYVVQDWNLSTGIWYFHAVFDGHAGEETADYAVQMLPSIVKQHIQGFLDNHIDYSPTSISDVLVNAISSLDNAIAHDLLEIFPDPQALGRLSDAAIRDIINDSDRGSQNIAKVLHCMRGTTVLVSLVDPAKTHLWVASLGDCQAVYGRQDESGGWDAILLSSNHNAAESSEVERIRQEHPDEPECILRHRVLGAIAVTRALGDHEFKLPRVYTERVFLNAAPGFRTQQSVGEFIKRSFTPPYVSNIADVRHLTLDPNSKARACLVMCTDGLMDLSEGDSRDGGTLDISALGKWWLEIIGPVVWTKGTNAALYLLRAALGGADEDKVSQMMTVERTDRWMDDTTILIQRL
ncbi:protein serine/threonine phosphatase 2C [Guyanagaster necrorhizus]|uniref:Protein serine/threonine phosphatase 2C n=1 Tax=Guyanagaster necrorhizus TaxID=856835 RepID=A0A9P7VS49_9AGAR|nr:protein serine/threonine phosphatase 2C [Guyanagaster necrorhizus MCA 3950]KAG7446428.1 protein serine/threonine phosphatase 2C [Guyanagaster necrorhizus MCA 3950]